MPHGIDGPQVAVIEDNADLFEGLARGAATRPDDNDPKIGNPAPDTGSRANYLEKRALGISCSGVSNDIAKPGLKIHGRVCTDQNAASRDPLIDDCLVLATYIKEFASTIIVPPNYCHQERNGTCLGYVCATCEYVTMGTDSWNRVHRALISHCVLEGECGYAEDVSHGLYEIGIEHSGAELPPYIW